MNVTQSNANKQAFGMKFLKLDDKIINPYTVETISKSDEDGKSLIYVANNSVKMWGGGDAYGGSKCYYRYQVPGSIADIGEKVSHAISTAEEGILDLLA